MHGQAKRTKHKEEKGNNNDSGDECSWASLRRLRLRLSRPNREYDRLCDWTYPCLIRGQDGMPLYPLGDHFLAGVRQDILRYIRMSQMLLMM